MIKMCENWMSAKLKNRATIVKDTSQKCKLRANLKRAVNRQPDYRPRTRRAEVQSIKTKKLSLNLSFNL